ncbi:MAG: HD domain-containing protein [Xanthomonadales bacterium]|nr:HD domain-containing protein [Xanthomonadales bacterium]
MTDLQALAAACETFVAGRTAADPAHDLSHIKRVVNNALYLSDIEKCNQDVVLPAAWLHDCVQVPKDSPQRAEASRLAADEAVRFLSSRDYPEHLLDAVHHAVSAHSFSAGIPVETIEAGVVQDADRLDALGAIGIARCLLTGGALGSDIYHPDDLFGEHRDLDDKAFMVDHFFTKLFKLPATMQTDAGRAEAERRVEQMRTFLQELRREVTPPR